MVLAKQLLRTLVEMPDGPKEDLSEEKEGVLPAAEEHFPKTNNYFYFHSCQCSPPLE
jgi:hypothetical protein